MDYCVCCSACSVVCKLICSNLALLRSRDNGGNRDHRCECSKVFARRRAVVPYLFTLLRAAWCRCSHATRAVCSAYAFPAGCDQICYRLGRTHWDSFVGGRVHRTGCHRGHEVVLATSSRRCPALPARYRIRSGIPSATQGLFIGGTRLPQLCAM